VSQRLADIDRTGIELALAMKLEELKAAAKAAADCGK
jgi:hypothetical protein